MYDGNPHAAKTDHIGCLGSFDLHQPLCRKQCALSLRCIIASHEQAILEQFESLFEFENMGGTADRH